MVGILLQGGACRPSGGGSSAATAGAGQLLTPDEKGRVDRGSTGATGIQGRWSASVDLERCQKVGKHAASECSVLITPDPQAPAFRPTADLGLCTVGVVAKVIPRPDGRPDWENMWGARISFTLNDDRPYDAPAHGVTGFAFHFDSEPAPHTGVRVQLPTLTANEQPAFWGGASPPVAGAGETSPVHAGRNELRWSEVGGPPWLDNPPRFDPTKLIAIMFLVPAHPTGARGFSFCIRELTALVN
jgi:hypothetical protein